MPVRTETLWSMPRLHVLFAVSAVLLLACVIWFAWEDYDRPWRAYQDDYMVAKAALAHLRYLETQQTEAQETLKEAETRVAQAHKAIADRSEELADLEAKLVELKGRYDKIKLEHGNADSVLQVTRDTYEKLLGEFGDEDEQTASAREQLNEEVEWVERLRLEREEIEDAQEETENKIEEIRGPSLEAQQALDQLVAAAAKAQKEEQQYGSVLLRRALNAPLVDFAAPKGTPARQELRQLLLPDVRQRLNYLESYTTDRCITCHIAIDDPQFGRRTLTATMERSLAAINEERERQGKEPLSYPKVPAAGVSPGEDEPLEIEPGQVAQYWGLLPSAARKEYLEALLGVVNVYLASTGRREISLRQPILAHPNLSLYVHADSAHPMKRMGCTICHEGNPQETDFVLAAHTPVDHHQEKRWRDKYYDRIVGIPTATFEMVSHCWDRLMLLPKYLEGSCGKCHTDTADISTFEGKPVGRKINYGRHLFTHAGCINCHNVNGLSDRRKVGPTLARVGSKLKPGFVESWILNPRDFRPATWMPHSFGQENNGPGSSNEHDPYPARRTRTEVSAIAYYLFTVAEPWGQMEKIPQGLTADTERGRKLFGEVGCLACHANLAEYGEAWITADVADRFDKTAAQAEADYKAMTLNQRVKYAWDHFPTNMDTVFHPERVRFDPESEYTPPIFTRRGPELSAMGSKTSKGWLYAWLRNPSSYHPETRMPSLRLTEQEALDLTAYLASLKHDEFHPEPFPEDGATAEMRDLLVLELLSGQRSERRARAMMNDANGALTRLLIDGLSPSPTAKKATKRIAVLSLEDKRKLYLGREMIAHYGCYACHTIAGFEGAARVGTDLTNWAEKPLSQLDFAFYDHPFERLRKRHPEVFSHLYPLDRADLINLAHGDNPEEAITRTHAAFAYHKIRNPRIWDRKKIKKPYEKLKMPNFYFSDAEAEALVTFLMGRRPPRVTENLKVDYANDPQRAIAAGRHLTRELNCVGCHAIEDNVAVIHQYYRTDEGGRVQFDQNNAPPALHGQGARVQPAWLYGYFLSVEPLRPWLEVRMPSFRLNNAEATTLVECFSGLSQKDSNELKRHLAQVEAYIAAAEKAADTRVGDGEGAGVDEDEEVSWPGDDWIFESALWNSKEFLGRYAVSHGLIRKYDLDPEENDPEDLMDSFRKVVQRTSFLQNLYSVHYPFADAPRALVAPERYEAGKGLFFRLRCLQCHTLGDADAQGANKNPTAPNLDRAYRRLRQAWVSDWLKGPPLIHPGTKMPQLFPNLESAFRDYGEARAELEKKYGSTAAEQIELLTDFLFNAGMKRDTVVQPGGLEGAMDEKAKEAGEDEGEDG